MKTKILVIECSDGSFDLRTQRGHRIGDRLVSSPPKPPDTIPEIPKYNGDDEGCFRNRQDAYAAAMAWNVYLHRQKR
jgi:hypothetical protein